MQRNRNTFSTHLLHGFRSWNNRSDRSLDRPPPVASYFLAQFLSVTRISSNRMLGTNLWGCIKTNAERNWCSCLECVSALRWKQARCLILADLLPGFNRPGWNWKGSLSRLWDPSLAGWPRLLNGNLWLEQVGWIESEITWSVRISGWVSDKSNEFSSAVWFQWVQI